MECILVSHTHWDREWYRTFQAFRARLVDTVDSVLDLIQADPGYRFLLDGQAVITEDYLEIRPYRRPELKRAAVERKITIGPWYVQPDSLMPSGEAHIRNLLEGRRVAGEIGPVSEIAYTPDSFGHPAQFPQILSGFGLSAFVYWRGNGNEVERLPSEYEWVAPDGTGILACLLSKGYGNASALPREPARAVEQLKPVVEELMGRTRSPRVLLMNGSDHLLPDPHTAEVAAALSDAIGATVVRGVLEDFVDGIGGDLPRFSGELVGGRIANLLPGVWSTRTYLKLRNRRCETLLEGWAEPWAAIGRVLGTPDERPSLRLAWRSLLHNQAHDSICGCSQDAVHEQMAARYDTSEEIAAETTTRVIERIAGLGPERRVPWKDSVTLAVFNPSPHPRTDIVRFPLDGYPLFGGSGESESVKLVATDVPAFGYKLVRLAPSEESADMIDDGREISAGDVAVTADDDGTFTVRFGDRRFRGIGALEDTGDRGDTYDFDPVHGEWNTEKIEISRGVHPGGINHLEVRRMLRLPAALAEDRMHRSDDRVETTVVTLARVAPGVGRIDLEVRVHNTARDHRLRMLFPTGGPAERFRAATTFDTAARSTAARDDSGWIHPAPKTFPSQGWVSVNGLTVAAPGLYEAEVTPQGVIAITLLRAVGWLSRPDLTTRPGPAGPGLETPGAQCLGTMTASISLMPDGDPRVPRDAELGLRAVAAAGRPLVDPNRSLLSLEPRALLLSALKPAEEANGIVVRVFNPTDEAIEAVLTTGFPVSAAAAIRLDETPAGESLRIEDNQIRFAVSPHAIYSLLLTT